MATNTKNTKKAGTTAAKSKTNNRPTKAAEKAANKVAEQRSANVQAPSPMQRNSFIVRNIMPSPIAISDMDMVIEPFEAKDLTWEDINVVQASRDLNTAMHLRYVTRISEEDFRKWKQKVAAQRQKEHDQELRNDQVLDNYSKQSAHMIDINSEAGKTGRTVSTSGYANDPATFLKGYEQAKRAAGGNLDPEDYMAQLNQSGGRITLHGNNQNYDPVHDATSGLEFNANNSPTVMQNTPDGYQPVKSARDHGIDLDVTRSDGDDATLELGVGETIDLEID